MQSKKPLVGNRLSKKIIIFYIVTILIVSFSPVVCLSDSPIINVEPDENVYTNNSYFEVTVDVSGNPNNISSFIDWNRNLVGYWNFEHGDATNIYDNSYYGHNLLYGHETEITSNIKSGKYGYSFEFDGSNNSFLYHSDDNAFDISDDLTLEAWIKLDGITFNETYKNGIGNSYATFVNKTSDGGYIVTGEAAYIPGNQESGDVWLLKLDANGTVEWSKTYEDYDDNNNDGNEDYGYCVRQTNDGGYIIVGAIAEPVPPKKNNSWLIKTDSEGNHEWNKSLGTIGKNDLGYSVIQASNGNYIVTGETNDSGYRKLWVLEISQDGETIVQEEKFVGRGSASGRSIKETSDGHYIVTGCTWDPTYEENIYILKLSTADINIGAGSSYSFGDEDTSDIGNDIIESSGTYVIIGESEFYSTSGKKDILFLEVNEDLEYVRHNSFGDEYDDVGFSVETTSDGGYIIAGRKRISESPEENDDMMLIKTDSEGTEIWNKTFGTDNDDRCQCVKEAEDGGYIIAGTNAQSQALEGWILKTDSYGNITNNIQKTIIGKGTSAYKLELINGTIFGYINGESHVQYPQGQYDLSNNWAHVVLVCNNSGIWLFINNENKSYNNMMDYLGDNDEQLIIGQNFTGYLDEIRIWNRSLSAQEISASFNSSLTGSYSRNFTNLIRGMYPYYVYGINGIGQETQNNTIYVTVNNPPTCTHANPENNSVIQDIRLTWSVSIEDADDDTFNWSIECENGDSNSANDDRSGSKSLSISGLEYNTEYTIWVNCTDGYNNTNDTFYFTTRSQYIPSPPSGFSATALNRSVIDISWTNNGSNNTVLEWYTSASWERGTGTELDNSTNTTYQHTGLSYGTTYYYQAWSYNSTDTVYSTTNSSDDATTTSNNAPSFSNENPENDTTTSISFTWNITIQDPEGDNFNWAIECENGDSNSANDDSNGSKDLSISGLSCDTTYKVWVNVTDDYNWTREWFNFTTNINNAPILSNENPTNETTDILTSISTLNVTIEDPNGDDLNWSIETNPNIGSQNNLSSSESNGSKVCSVSGLSAGTQYTWFVNATDGFNWSNATYTFTTDQSSHSSPSNNDGNNQQTETANITCYRCINGSLETQVFNQSSCPAGWNSTIPSCSSGQNITYPSNNTTELGNLTNNTNFSFSINSTIITNLGFIPKINLTNLNFTVFDNGTELPEDMSIESLNRLNLLVENLSIYKFFNTSLKSNSTKVNNTDIKNITIRFKVNQTWISNNNITNESLFVYKDNNWVKINISRKSNDTEYIYYEASVPALSTFAVVGSKVVEKGEAFDTSDEPEIPWIIIIGIIIAAVAILIIVLFKSRFIYIEEDKENEEK